MIATTPRTGSHFLSEVVANTGRLGRPREYFNRYVNPRLADGASDSTSTAAARCALVDGEGTTPNGVASFKLFPNHLQWLLGGVRLSEWYPDIGWVHLYREDKIGQAISWAMAKETALWWAGGKAAESLEYSAEAIEIALIDILNDEADWAAYFLRNRIEPLRLSYEAVERDPTTAVAAIAAHLGVELDGPPATQRSTFVKQRGAHTEEWRERFHADSGSIDRLDAPFRRRYAPRTLGSLRDFLGGRLLVGPVPWRFREDADG